MRTISYLLSVDLGMNLFHDIISFHKIKMTDMIIMCGDPIKEQACLDSLKNRNLDITMMKITTFRNLLYKKVLNSKAHSYERIFRKHTDSN